MTLLSPSQRAILRAQGEDGISGTIAAPAAQDYIIFLVAPFACQITGIQNQLTAGTQTVNVKNAGVSVVGLSAIAVTVASLRTNPTAGSTTSQVAEGAIISITVTVPVGAANWSYVLFYKRI